jgi:hypothetical protein
VGRGDRHPGSLPLLRTVTPRCQRWWTDRATKEEKIPPNISPKNFSPVTYGFAGAGWEFFCRGLYYPDDDITTRQPHIERARKHDTTTTTAKATVVLQLVDDDHLGHSHRATGDGDTPYSPTGVVSS